MSQRTNATVFLVTVDSTKKIRQVALNFKWNDERHAYIIRRITGTYKGKLTLQPEIIVDKGKVNRSPTEQVNLQFNHLLKEYCDKGYKEIPCPANDMSEQELREIVGDVKTNIDGLLKPMLAKQADQVSNKKVFDKIYYISRKINGVRCLMYSDASQKGRIRTASRGAMNYDMPTSHIRLNESLEKWFNKHPHLILDGEVYKHGWTLNKISGICRTQDPSLESESLEYWIYDVIDTDNLDMQFNERNQLLLDIAAELNLGFEPERSWEENDLKIQLVPQLQITGYENMKKEHDKYVSEGFEGAVVRLITSTYGPGKRTNDMIKIKQYTDAEYKIVGISEGLRDEDMCFVMETETGQQFKAKPVGDRDQKQWYRDNINDLIGKMGTLKYFEMSGKEGSEIPQQPIFLCVRDYE